MDRTVERWTFTENAIVHPHLISIDSELFHSEHYPVMILDFFEFSCAQAHP